jgi:DNA-binding MarR family transcriptional regulator
MEAKVAPPAALPARAGFLLAQLGRAATRSFSDALAPTGLKPPHTAVLVQLRARGAVTQQALGDVLCKDPSNLVALLNDLEEAGLAVRRRDPDDRRRHIVELSRRGAARLEDAERALAAAQDELLAGLDEDERAELERLLTRAGRASGTAAGWCHGE